jgi:hypothetical protein
LPIFEKEFIFFSKLIYLYKSIIKTKNNFKKMIFETLDFSILLGVIVGASTIILAIIWTILFRPKEDE